MALGNRYGIDLGNVLSAESAIKSARLNIKSRELQQEKEGAGRALRKNVLDVKSNVLAEKELSKWEEHGLEGGYTEPTETLPQEEINRLSSIAPEVAGQIEQTAQAQQRQESLTKYYESKGVPKEEAVLRASGFNKDIETFNKEFQAKDKATQQSIKDN
ncbi:hypothetical protein DRO61_10965, partial [Candidatus Bathyarchaeota archaeon]